MSLFLDRIDIQPGMAWQDEIFKVLDGSRRVLTLFSPDDVASPMCNEELNIALARAIKRDDPVVFPIFLRDADLPPHMGALGSGSI